MAHADAHTDGNSGRFAYEGLERTIHERARLSIMTSLASHPKGLVFCDLKELCSLTDGNLSRHLQTLQESGLVEIVKTTHGNRPQTIVCLSDDGRRRFLEYIAVLESVVADALVARKQEGTPTVASLKPVGLDGSWSPA